MARQPLAFIAIVSGIVGCTAPDTPSKPIANISEPPATQQVVMVELSDPLETKPVWLSADRLRYLRDQADALATSSRLPPLTSDSMDEVRIWETFANFDPNTIGYDTFGYVISRARVLKCKITYSRDQHTSLDGQCAALRSQPSSSNTIPPLETLLPYADSDIDCGIQDGVWYTLDIVQSGKRLVISASNPASCKGSAAATVASLIDAVHRLE